MINFLKTESFFSWTSTPLQSNATETFSNTFPDIISLPYQNKKKTKKERNKSNNTWKSIFFSAQMVCLVDWDLLFFHLTATHGCYFMVWPRLKIIDHFIYSIVLDKPWRFSMDKQMVFSPFIHGVVKWLGIP